MKFTKLVLAVLIVVVVGACASKGSGDLKSPCACGESKTQRG